MSRILVISDDQAFAYSLRVLLIRDGHAVMVADDASAGLFRLFMDEPWFVVVHLAPPGEVRKVCRHLHESAGVPFLVIGLPGLLEDPELKAWLPPDRFLSLPASVRRIWLKVTEILGQLTVPPDVESAGGTGSGKGPGRPDKPGRPADYQCRAYQKHSRTGRSGEEGPSLQIWV